MTDIADMNPDELIELADALDRSMHAIIADLRRMGARMVALSKPTDITAEMVFNDLLMEGVDQLLAQRVDFTSKLEFDE